VDGHRLATMGWYLDDILRCSAYGKLELLMMNATKQQISRGFTIVELLIVIVVIGILAAITIVAFNGVQQKAAVAAIQSDLTQNAKAIMSAAATSSTGQHSTLAAMPGGAANVKLDLTKYKVASYCGDANNFVLAVQTTSGDEYYTKTGSAVVKDNTIDIFRPCDSVPIASAFTTYLNLPTACAAEGGQCTFTGTVTIAYGNVAQGKFSRLVTAASPITCSHASMSIVDPIPGYTKSCFMYPN